MYRFRTGQRFVWDEVTYEVTQVHPNDRMSIVQMDTGELFIIDLDTLTTAFFNRTLSFCSTQKKGQRSDPSNSANLLDYPLKYQLTAEYRLWAVEPLLKIKRLTDADVLQRVDEVRTLIQGNMLPIQTYYDENKQIRLTASFASFRRWIKALRESSNDIRVLIPNYNKCGGEGTYFVDPIADKVIDSVIDELYMRRERSTVVDVYDEVIRQIGIENRVRDDDEQIPIPSQRTVYRRVDTRGLMEKFASRHGRRMAERAVGQYGEFKPPDRPMKRVEIDGTRADIIVVDPETFAPLGRPSIVYCIDTTTRYPLGYSLSFNDSYDAVADCLYHVIRPKTDTKEKYELQNEWLAYGVPQTLFVDRGRAFKNKHLRLACQQLGIDLQLSPVRTPEMKAIIERAFGALNNIAFHPTEGTTLSNILQRGDYNSVKMACVSLEELDKIIHKALIDVYAQDNHRGLMKAQRHPMESTTPAGRWQEFVDGGYVPHLPATLQELDILLSYHETRTIQHYGIDIFGGGLRYNAPELGQIRAKLKHTNCKRKDGEKGNKVRVRYRRSDLGQIFVRNPFSIVPKYIEARCTNPEYANNLTLAEHEQIKQYIREQGKEVNRENIAEAKLEIRQMVGEAHKRKKGKTTSKKYARLSGADRVTARMPSRSESDEVTLLPAAPDSTDDTSNSRNDNNKQDKLPEIDFDFDLDDELADMGFSIEELSLS